MRHLAYSRADKKYCHYPIRESNLSIKPCVRRCRNFWVLIGTASTWFLLDIAFYSQNLFLPNILEGIGYNPKINLPASKCVKTKTCPHYNLPVSSASLDVPRLTTVA